VNLNELVQQVIGTLTIIRPQSEVEFRIPQSLKSVQCDRAQINELFSNLISNGIKYNDKLQKWVEIGCVEGNGESKFYLATSLFSFFVYFAFLAVS
jgi:light-regulated signal transduction histidine kinase (bacteriophytochrome)